MKKIIITSLLVLFCIVWFVLGITLTFSIISKQPDEVIGFWNITLVVLIFLGLMISVALPVSGVIAYLAVKA